MMYKYITHSKQCVASLVGSDVDGFRTGVNCSICVCHALSCLRY